jgi:tripartite-type tricarboxylate transporter receptor subunit TctC
VGSTPEAFAALIQKELKMYGALIKKANIKQE